MKTITLSRLLRYLFFPGASSYFVLLILRLIEIVIDLNFMREFNCHHKTSIVFIIEELRAWARPSAAPGLGVWSPEGLYDKSVSLIPNTDEILKLVKKKMN